jgi:hypothetical protein
LFYKNITGDKLTRYYNFHPDEATFSKNISKNHKKYIETSDTDTEAYQTFWNEEVNRDVLQRYVKPQSCMFDAKLLSKYLRSAMTNIKHQQILRAKPFYAPITVEKAIEICEYEMNIKIKRLFTFMPVYQLYAICDLLTGKYVGYFYLRVIEKYEHPSTQPLGDSYSLIRSPLTIQLIHEILHATQYCFNSPFEIPKELVEIPAMMLEKKYASCSDTFIDKTLALAIADLETDNFEEFDNTFNRLAQTDIYVKPSHRFWHYINYPKQYFSYALGLIIGDYSLISDWVRHPEKITNYIGVLLQIPVVSEISPRAQDVKEQNQTLNLSLIENYR